MSRVFVGRIAHTPSLGSLELIGRGAIVVNGDGIIEAVHRDEADVAAAMAAASSVEDFGESFLVPGLIDTHAHAPQYAQLGLGTDLPLLDWLNKYTFPTESRFKDADFAARVYSDVVKRSLYHGTTTVVWFASHHLEATKRLADVSVSLGQHGFIGKVNMDRNSPDFYVEESAQRSLADTKELIEYVQGLKSPLVTPIVTPRFAISCSSQLMKGLGQLAEEYKVPIQSHISENKAEIDFTADLHPECAHYSDVYASHGLLNDRTIMAHGVHLSEEEIKLFAASGAGISHCPNSNFTLCSGQARVRRLLKHGVNVGLGTDMSGGYAPSMWEALRSALFCSAAVVSEHPEDGEVLSYKEALYLATMGSAKLIGMSNLLGSFEPGKWFNAQVIDPARGGVIDFYDKETLDDIFQKCVYLVDDRNISHVFVKGENRKH